MLSHEEWQAVSLSFKVASLSTLALLPLAFTLAWLLARKNFPGKSLLNLVIHMPLVVPPVVTGYALLLSFGRQGFIGHALETCCGVIFSFRWTGAVLAAAVMSLPLMVRPIRLAIETIQPAMVMSAASLGATPSQVLRRVIIPLCYPGLLAGAVMAFAKALGEFGATITFVANIPGETQTLPSAIYSSLQVPGEEGHAFLLSAIAVALSFAVLILSERLSIRIMKGLGYF
jgi:molybdate transport system permease protein